MESLIKVAPFGAPILFFLKRKKQRFFSSRLRSLCSLPFVEEARVASAREKFPVGTISTLMSRLRSRCSLPFVEEARVASAWENRRRGMFPFFRRGCVRAAHSPLWRRRGWRPRGIIAEEGFIFFFVAAAFALLTPLYGGGEGGVRQRGEKVSSTFSKVAGGRAEPYGLSPQ
jgi:hypothetical protein